MSILLYISSFLLASAGAWIIARYGSALKTIDYPNERSSHCELTPKGGGVGILLSFCLAALIIGIPTSFWLAVALIALPSFITDRIELSVWLRLFFHFAAAILLLTGMTDPVSRPMCLPIVMILVVFVVGTANFYNFMDGINGLAAITGIVAFSLVAVFGIWGGKANPWITLSFCLSLSCLGFLPLNVPKARVFLGDVGSILLGFTFAGLVVQFASSLLDFICLTSFLFPFYADELTTMVVRISSGDNLLHPHRKHLYQLLANELNIDHWKISLVYGCLQLLIGIMMMVARECGLAAVILLWLGFLLLFAIVSFHVRQNIANSC